MKALFTDIDGTLITSDLTISPATRDILRKWTDSGNLHILSSSRSAPGIEPLAKSYDLPCCISAVGGALLLDNERRVIYENGFSVSLCREILEFLCAKQFNMTWGVYTKDLWITKDRSDPRITTEKQVVKISAAEGSVDDIPEDAPVEKILCMFDDPEETLKTENALIERFPTLSILKSSPVFVEINNAGVSKANAVHTICEHFNIDIADTIAFGDNYNDLLMLKAAGTGVAMGNAPDDIKAAADYVTDDHNHDGIAKFLQNTAW